MSAEKTEKATPRRIQKAREDGRFPVSREAVNSATFAIAVWLIVKFLPDWLLEVRDLSIFVIRRGFSEDFGLNSAFSLWRAILTVGFVPLLAIGAAITATGLALQFGITGFGISTKQLSPKFSRLNPLNRLKQMPGQNMQSAAQSLVLLAVFGALIYWKIPAWIGLALQLPRQALGQSLSAAGAEIAAVLKWAVFVFVLFGTADYARQRIKYFRELKMTKQEVRDESKESEGNSQVKQKIRRLQRDAARRQMMAQVPKATAVIVNPTHYAIAIQYQVDSMAAPRVVAKGKNYLARRIREIAMEHEIPIVENPPLARSLYKHVEVGHEIPAAFYRAVAEVLAYIYRLMNGRLPGR